MKLPVAARDLGPVPSADLVQWVLGRPDGEWDADPYRQQAFAVHRHTRTLRAVWTEPSSFPSSPTVLAPWWDDVRPALEPVLAAIAAHMPGPTRLANAMFARLEPGAHITMHSDTARFFAHCHRVHVPLQTEPGVMFVVGGQRVPFEVGRAWEIDNTRLHGVTHAGRLPRVHCIVDLAPG